jgi:peroxiredoxin
MKILAIALLFGLGLSPAFDAESDAFDAAKALKKSGKVAEAGAAFEAFAKAFPDSPRVGEALVEAGVGWFGVARDRQVLHRATPESDEAFGKAHDFFAQVAADRPSDPSAGRAQYMLGSTDLFLGDLPSAEKDYSLVLEKFASDPKYVPKSLERRAAVRRHLLQDDLALADLHKYLADYPKGEEAESVARYVQFAGLNGKQAPAIDPAAWIQGGPHTLESLHGHVVGLYFFATWCEKCAKEMPFVRELARRTEPSGMVFIGVLDRSKGQTVESVRAFMKENDLPFAAFMDKARTKPAYLGTTIPDLVLIDKAGRVRWHDHPANLAEYTLETLIGEDDSKAEAAVPK